MDARTSPFVQCSRAWAVAGADGPASAWPRLAPHPGLEACCRDRLGMGMPAESLPLALQAYSVCGWRPVLRAGRLELEAGAPEPVNAEGCRRHLELNRGTATRVFMAWEALQAMLLQQAQKPQGLPDAGSRQEPGAPAASVQTGLWNGFARQP
ncbi:MAG: hypothetical protein K6E40_04670 [Desulfovibrio sp.]|nr:hypothetical protein [Desulfovibrio sp.]